MCCALLTCVVNLVLFIQHRLPRLPQTTGGAEVGNKLRLGCGPTTVVSDFGFRVSGPGLRVSGFGLRASGFGLRVSGLGFCVSGVGCRFSGCGTDECGARLQIFIVSYIIIVGIMMMNVVIAVFLQVPFLSICLSVDPDPGTQPGTGSP